MLSSSSPLCAGAGGGGGFEATPPLVNVWTGGGLGCGKSPSESESSESEVESELEPAVLREGSKETCLGGACGAAGGAFVNSDSLPAPSALERAAAIAPAFRPRRDEGAADEEGAAAPLPPVDQNGIAASSTERTE